MKKYALAAALLVALFWHGIASAQVWRYGDPDTPKIAITVDDCCKTQHMSEILDLCEEYAIPVTFFPIGNAIQETDGDLWRRALSLGCEIGNHTYGHACLLDGFSDAQARSQLVHMEKALDTALNEHYEIQLYRPPYGREGRVEHRKRYAQCGYENIIKWSICQSDVEACLKQVKNGSILLFHTNQVDVRCLRELIPAVLELGLMPVTVSELLNLSPIVKERTEKELVFPPAA